jgi:hypothetical protein
LPSNITVRLPEELIVARRQVPLSRDRSFLLSADASDRRADTPAWRIPDNW